MGSGAIRHEDAAGGVASVRGGFLGGWAGFPLPLALHAEIPRGDDQTGKPANTVPSE